MKLTLTAPNIPVLLGGDGKSKESTKGNNMPNAHNPHALTQGDLVVLMNALKSKIFYNEFNQDQANEYGRKMYYKRKKNRLSAIQYKLKKLHKEVSRG